MFSMADTDFRCFLAVESASGTNKPCLYTENSGEFLEAGILANIHFNADMGHNLEEPKTGSAMVVVHLRSCNVLDHFTITVHTS